MNKKTIGLAMGISLLATVILFLTVGRNSDQDKDDALVRGDAGGGKASVKPTGKQDPGNAQKDTGYVSTKDGEYGPTSYPEYPGEYPECSKYNKCRFGERCIYGKCYLDFGIRCDGYLYDHCGTNSKCDDSGVCVQNTTTGCGNGVQEDNEECDEGEGNLSPFNATAGNCTTACTLASCGDGVLNYGEVCDAGGNGTANSVGICNSTDSHLCTNMTYNTSELTCNVNCALEECGGDYQQCCIEDTCRQEEVFDVIQLLEFTSFVCCKDRMVEGGDRKDICRIEGTCSCDNDVIDGDDECEYVRNDTTRQTVLVCRNETDPRCNVTDYVCNLFCQLEPCGQLGQPCCPDAAGCKNDTDHNLCCNEEFIDTCEAICPCGVEGQVCCSYGCAGDSFFGQTLLQTEILPLVCCGNGTVHEGNCTAEILCDCGNGVFNKETGEECDVNTTNFNTSAFICREELCLLEPCGDFGQPCCENKSCPGFANDGDDLELLQASVPLICCNRFEENCRTYRGCFCSNDVLDSEEDCDYSSNGTLLCNATERCNQNESFCWFCEQIVCGQIAEPCCGNPFSGSGRFCDAGLSCNASGDFGGFGTCSP